LQPAVHHTDSIGGGGRGATREPNLSPDRGTRYGHAWRQRRLGIGIVLLVP